MDFSLARTNMVKSQVAPNGVDSPVLLSAMLSTPREVFVAGGHQPFAYSDHALPLSGARRTLKPMQIGKLVQALSIAEGSKVLVVGAGTGYEATLLHTLGAVVFALETDEVLAKQGMALGQTGSIAWRVGAWEQGWSEQAPFDGILVCGAVEGLPEPLLAQLGDQGRLVAIIGKAGDVVMHAVRVQGGREQKMTTLFETIAFPLVTAGDGQPFVL
ncbi:MAG: hypothetical protein H7837_00510 [Magnetococcus sp. MYC-9]